jgi:hypothetical protein
MKPRETKFRVWSKERNEMAEIQDYPCLQFEEKGRWFAMNGDKLFCNFLNGVLMQYTGFKDINGKMIYEGDIVKTYKEFEIVEWKELPAGDGWGIDGWGYEDYSGCEVVGNIYENKELIK